MRILVTGAAGFIGSTLVDRLLQRGDQITGVDNFDPFYSPAEKRANLAAALSSPGFRLVECDVVSTEAVNRAFENGRPNVIVHLAAKTGVRPSIGDPAGYEKVNVGGTQAVLEAAARHGIEAFVLASSSSVYGNGNGGSSEEADPVIPVSPYAATKRSAEALCRAHQQAHGGSVQCLRLFTAYGPRQRPDLVMRHFCNLLSSGQPVPMFGNGDSERDYTWVGDIVDAIAAAIDRAGTGRDEFDIINVGTGRAVTLRRVVELLGATLGVQPMVEHHPRHPGDVTRTCADLTKARRLLGYTPSVNIEEGVNRFVRWFHQLKP